MTFYCLQLKELISKNETFSQMKMRVKLWRVPGCHEFLASLGKYYSIVYYQYYTISTRVYYQYYTISTRLSVLYYLYYTICTILSVLEYTISTRVYYQY